MKQLLKFPLFAFCLLTVNCTNAQTAIKMLSGGASTTASGPVITQQTINLFDESTNAALATPVTATFSYTLQNFGPGTVQGNNTWSALSFGQQPSITAPATVPPDSIPGPTNLYQPSTNATLTTVAPLVPNTNLSDFTAYNGATPGFTAADYFLEMFTTSDALINQNGTNKFPLNSSQYMGDLTITFNRPVSNPVIHLQGLGGYYGVNPTVGGVARYRYLQGFTTDYTLASTQYTLLKLNGSTYFNVTGNDIKNSATHFGLGPILYTNAGVDTYGAEGSVEVQGTNITTVVFKLYLRGDGGVIIDKQSTPPNTIVTVGDLSTTGNPYFSVFSSSKDGDVTLGVPTNSAVMTGDKYQLGLSLKKPVTLSGNVFNDPNAGNVNNSTGTTNAVPSGLFANLVDALGNVVASVAVNTDGTYSFPAIFEGNYTVNISTTSGTQASVAPSASLPAGWANTGYFNGTPGSGNVANNGTSTSITVSSTDDVTNINFGIQQPPLANQVTLTNSTNPGGTNTVDITSSFGGSDPSTAGEIDSIRITAFPLNATSITINGTLYTSANFPAGGVVVLTNTSGVPTSPILIDPIDGTTTVNVPYVTYDNAGSVSSIPGNVIIPFINSLPLNLLSFSANVNQNCHINLQWRTANELDVISISVLKSLNGGSSFEEVGNVVSKGNNATYTFTTTSAEYNNCLYKLKINNLNGRSDYSNTISVKGCFNTNQILIYPNPTTDKLTITFQNLIKGYNYKIYNYLGEIVKSEESIKNVNSININVSNLVSGVYYFKLINDGKTTTTVFLIK